MPAISDWANFFVAELGAAAALTGLVIVAISINLKEILKTSSLPGRAIETLAMLVAILFAATFGLIPGQPQPVLGGEWVLVGAVLWAIMASAQFRTKRATGEPAWSLPLRFLLGQCASLPYIVAGASLASGAAGGVYWLVPATVFCVFGGMFNTWVLLVEIIR